MGKYDGIENIGEIMVLELYATIEDKHITENELFRKKLVNKFCETYNLALQESIDEVQDSINAIKSLKI